MRRCCCFCCRRRLLSAGRQHPASTARAHAVAPRPASLLLKLLLLSRSSPPPLLGADELLMAASSSSSRGKSEPDALGGAGLARGQSSRVGSLGTLLQVPPSSFLAPASPGRVAPQPAPSIPSDACTETTHQSTGKVENQTINVPAPRASAKKEVALIPPQTGAGPSPPPHLARVA